MTGDRAVLRAYVYKVFTYPGGVPLGWYPTSPSNVEFAYTLHDIPGTEPFSAAISGLNVFSPGSLGIWSADVDGGVTPYSYKWYRSYSSSSGPWTQVSTSSSYGQTVTQEMWLKLTANDAGSGYDSDIMHIYTTGCSTPPCPIPKVAGQTLPTSFAINQNYPNPFNPTTTIKYELPEQAEVTLEVFNVLGRKVASLVNTSQEAGFYEVNFDGQGLASGLYIARLQAVGQTGESIVKELKMQLIK